MCESDCLYAKHICHQSLKNTYVCTYRTCPHAYGFFLCNYRPTRVEFAAPALLRHAQPRWYRTGRPRGTGLHGNDSRPFRLGTSKRENTVRLAAPRRAGVCPCAEVEGGFRGKPSRCVVCVAVLQFDENEAPSLYEIPHAYCPFVPLHHPEYKWFADLGLRWYSIPAVSCLEVRRPTHLPSRPIHHTYLPLPLPYRCLSAGCCTQERRSTGGTRPRKSPGI